MADEVGLNCKQNNFETHGKLRNMTGIYLTCGDKILLLYRQGSRVVNNLWVASAGGHLEAFELNDAKACVLRELKEELGLTEHSLTNLRLRYATLRRMEGEIRVNYYFFAELKGGTEMQLKSDEGTLRWFPMEEIEGLEMPFTAGFVLKHYLETGRRTAELYGGVADGEKVVFVEMEA